jgi:hypothetical protein
LGDAGASAGGMTPVFPDALVRCVDMIFSGVLVPVIPLPQKPLKRTEETLEPAMRIKIILLKSNGT